MLFFYRILTFFLFPFFVAVTFSRRFYNKEDKIRFKEKIFPSYFRAKKKRENKLIWFHASSVGELKSILPIIKDIDKKNKNL